MADEALYYGTGRRKNAVARVRLVPGTGKVTINGRDGEEYFGREALFNFAMTPFKVTDTAGHFDVKARIDGGGELKTFTTIVFPMIKPGVGALAIFTFINTWNDYFMQLLMLTGTNVLSMPLGISKMMGEFGQDYGLLMAGATLASVPIIIVFLAFQKYFTKGITMGAVKG